MADLNRNFSYLIGSDTGPGKYSIWHLEGKSNLKNYNISFFIITQRAHVFHVKSLAKFPLAFMAALKEQHQQRTGEERMVTDFSEGSIVHTVGMMALTDLKICMAKMGLYLLLLHFDSNFMKSV